ncbi:DNA polymerase [Anaerovibrio sp.]|uniref:DNA polymerase n=1 Tax=Anaerovibrio sp. TaxID=1872532 RepID=UPI0025C360B7|nr:DNA polymerase [Anaerovibrio sp.]MBR2142064.1 DNA polymerase [Anaerovibrio sp.]
MTTLYIDIETYSSNDIKLGVHKYVDALDFEIMLLAYAFDDEPVKVIDLKAGEQIPDRLKFALIDIGTVKTAFNANFELTCLRKAFPDLVVQGQWECDSVLALYHSLPPGLDAVGKALGLPQDKQKDARGKKLIQFFCKPCKPTKKNGGRVRNLPEDDPEGWAVFKEYNAQDVVTEREIRKRLLWLKPTDEEHTLWLLDHEINLRGIGIDMDLVRGAQRLDEEYSKELLEKAGEITGLENPNSAPQLKGWLALNGRPVESLNKEAVEALLKDDTLHPTIKKVLKIRASLGMTSVKKYTAMADSICSDGRAHDLFQFYGASRTGRWAGRNIQLQNLTKNHIDDLDLAREYVKEADPEWVKMMFGNVKDLLSQLVRTALVPQKGNKFIVADFSAIEARVIAWLSGEHWRMEAFRNGEDIYCSSASRMFGVPVQKHGVNAELRQRGKVAELALGYGGGISAMKDMGGDKLNLTDEELQQIVTKWRKASPKIPALWRKIESAAMSVIRHEGPCKARVVVDRDIWFEKKDNKDLLLHLPSGRYIVYLNAGIGENRFGNESIVYDGMNPKKKNEYGRLETYGGKLTENLVQAVARDCLGEAMINLEIAGYTIVAHVHDEVICEVPDNDNYTLDKAVEIMTQGSKWSEGLLLNADGFESYYYMKD